MFENCTIKYFKETNFSTGEKENVGIKVVHPESNGERKIQSVLIRSKDNTLYQDIMKWVAEGNTIEEAD